MSNTPGLGVSTVTSPRSISSARSASSSSGVERRGVASRGASASGAGGGEGCLGTPNLQMSGTSGGSAETRRRRTIRAASMGARRTRGGRPNRSPRRSAPRDIPGKRARVRGEAAHAEGTRSPEARAGDAGSFSARTLRGWTVVVLIFAAHGPRGGRARPNSATSSRLNAKNTISYLYRAEGNRRRPTLTTDTQETRSFLELLFDEPVRGARALKRPSSRPRSASSDSHFVYSEERQNSTFHDDLLRSFTCRDATPRLEGAHGLVAPSSSFVASSRQGERAAVAQDAQSDQAEASPCDASPLLNHTDTGSCPPLSGVRPFCGPTPRAPREDPRPRGCARERALDPSSAHLAPRGGLRGTARVQHGPSDGTLRCVFWFV